MNNPIPAAISEWLLRHPDVKDMLGRAAVVPTGTSIAGPPVEEFTKGLGIARRFFLSRAAHHNVPDGCIEITGAALGVRCNWFQGALDVVRGFAECGEAPRDGGEPQVIRQELVDEGEGLVTAGEYTQTKADGLFETGRLAGAIRPRAT